MLVHDVHLESVTVTQTLQARSAGHLRAILWLLCVHTRCIVDFIQAINVKLDLLDRSIGILLVKAKLWVEAHAFFDYFVDFLTFWAHLSLVKLCFENHCRVKLLVRRHEASGDVLVEEVVRLELPEVKRMYLLLSGVVLGYFVFYALQVDEIEVCLDGEAVDLVWGAVNHEWPDWRTSGFQTKQVVTVKVLLRLGF